MTRGRSTAVLAVLAAALGAYIYFVDRHRAPAPADAPEAKGKVFAGVDAAKVEEVRIDRSSGESATLRKVNGAWRLVAPIDVAADDSEASNLASNLATADIQSVVDEKPKDLAAFGLAKPRLTLTFKTAGGPTRTLLVGDKNPIGSDLYARLPDAPRVFLVSGYLDGTFDKGVFQLRDKRVLAFDREKVDRIDATAGTAAVTVVRQADVWSVTKPWAARADFGVIESVLSRLAGGQMKAIVWDPSAPPAPATPPAAAKPHSLKAFGLDPAERRLTLGAGSTTAELLLGKASPEGDVYAKDARRDLVFTIEKALADDLSRQPADFRAKDVFAFRAFTGTRLEIAHGGKTYVFERKKGTEKDAVEKWVAVQPAKAVDEAKIEDLVGKVSTLRAESFADALPAGAVEFARIQTTFDAGKKRETVVVHQAGPDYYAVREGDAGAAKLIAPAVADVITALEATQK
jgi:uncharacterized protein DUF4340